MISCPRCSSLKSFNDEHHILMGECLECNFVFCTNCEKEFHGFEDCDTQTEVKDVFECKICFMDTPLEEAANLGCEHLNCKACVKQYYETLIKSGSIHSFKCPSEKTCNALISPNTVKELVDPQIFAKYDSFLLDEALQDFPEIVTCPKTGCGKLLASKPEYGHCDSCDYRFCTNCMRAYHGLNDCNQTEQERLELIKKLLEAGEAERERLEREEQERKNKIEKDTLELISKTSKKCPQCRTDVEKNGGCNRMTCKCSCTFCWLCNQVLTGDPYIHFTERGGGPCTTY